MMDDGCWMLVRMGIDGVAQVDAEFKVDNCLSNQVGLWGFDS